MKPEELYGEFDHVQTGIYIPIDTLLIFTFVMDSHSQFKKQMLKKRQNAEI
jgi:hypothetical protein